MPADICLKVGIGQLVVCSASFSAGYEGINGSTDGLLQSTIAHSQHVVQANLLQLVCELKKREIDVRWYTFDVVIFGMRLYTIQQSG